MIQKSFVLALGVSIGSVTFANDTVDNAFRLCAALEGTGLLSSECEVSGWNQTVEVIIDTSGSEARSICVGVSKMMVGIGAKFDKGWKLKIYSPYSGEKTIAFCSLPN